ncbi:MAG: hypothetical protein FJW34_10155 [Acidobacteria bacterium]|nr:hypothetical protein [Acidobacteriota bacterium]
MPSDPVEFPLARLEQLKTSFTPQDAAHIERLLARLERARFRDPVLLGRFHEALLFVLAHPCNARILRHSERLLATFTERVAPLRAAGADLYPLEDPEISGIAGTAFSAIFTYPIACHLAARYPGAVDMDWEAYEDASRMGPSLPRWIPLLEEDTFVEANVPFKEWVDAARGRKPSLAWLLARLAEWRGSPEEKAGLYDALRIPLRWEMGDSPAARTHTRLPAGRIYYQRTPLIRRSEVSLEAALDSPPLPLRRLSARRGAALLDLLRDTSAARYRELWGFSYGDPDTMLEAEAGRGVRIFVNGLPPPPRLPLRAYHAGLFVKNGVLVGYFETLSLFERCEVGFNVYYTFREGESAWLYGRLLRLLNQVLGVTCFSMDPYQLGHHNEEAIKAGAFWFYRKLGLRPMRPDLVRLADAEAEKILRRPGYRTPARTLERLAECAMIYERPGSPVGDWDRFEARKLGMAAARRMARSFGGDARRAREAAIEEATAALGIHPNRWGDDARRAFTHWAPVLALIPDLARWSEAEKRAVAAILRAKGGAEESRYLRLMQAQPRLRRAVLRLGS